MHMIYKVILTACLSVLFTTTVAAATVTGLFPTSLSENTTGQNDSYFVGPPDDNYSGIGGQIVTFDFGGDRVVNGEGQDFNVYEVDFAALEFDKIDVLASIDGSTFFNVTNTMDAVVRIIGDSTHGNDSYARSFDLPDVLAEARYIRIDGKGTGTAGGSSGFDLDAIGAINYRLAIVPLPPSAFLFLSSLLGLVFLRKKS